MSATIKPRARSQEPEAIDLRKNEHLDVCLNEEVQSGASTGLGGFTLEYDALPELDLDEVELETTVLGKRLKAPLLIGAMTGGTERASEINRRLARAAARVGVGMALGSQRAMIRQRDMARTYAVRDAAPDLPLLIGNVGAVQLNLGLPVDDLIWALRAVTADAVSLHLNPLQEAIQPEGDTQFGGLLESLNLAIPQIPLPVLVKEVGAGISERTADKLAKLPLAGIETAGVGGTSWALVESFRAEPDSVHAEVGRRLRGFGTATARSIVICRQRFENRLVIASGGLRTGMDVAVALALGADAVAIAQPFLEAADKGEDAVVAALETLLYELKVILFCTGSRNLAALKQVRLFRPA